MDLNDLVLQGSFAKAFEMTDFNNSRQIDDVKLKNEASKWFEMMQGVNLDSMTIQEFYLKQRAKLDGPPTKTSGSPNPSPGPNPNPNPGGGPNPNPGGGPNPFPKRGGEGQPNPMPNPKTGGGLNPFPRPGAEGQPNPAGVPKQGQGLAGTTWSGTETLQGYDQLSFQFKDGGQVIMIDKDGNTPGTWSRVGNSVTLRFDIITYNGTIQANRMQGNATNTRDRWTWTVMKQ